MNRWSSLRTKIVAWFFIPTAIILVAVALVTFYAYQQVTEELVLERDQELTRLTASQLAAELTEYTELLGSIARSLSLYGENRSAQTDVLRGAANRLSIFDAGVLFLDPFGTVEISQPANPEFNGQDRATRDYYLEILRAQILGAPRPVFSNIVADGPGGVAVIVVGVSVTGEQEEFVGVLLGMIRIGAGGVSPFYGDIVKLRIKSSGSTYLLDGNQRVIFHSSSQRIGQDYSTNAIIPLIQNQTGAKRLSDPLTEDIVASYAPIPSTPWTLVIEESWDTLTAGGRGYQRYLLLLLALGVVVPALVVTAGIRRVMRPIDALIQASQEVARGNFGQSIEAQSGDEIGELAGQFNLMSAQLQESYATLERRVEDRTRELATLNAIAEVVSRSLDLDEILNNALDKTLQTLSIEAGGVYLLDEDTQLLNIVAQRGFPPPLVEEIDNLRVGEGFSGRVVESGEPIVVNDISTDPRLTRIRVADEGYHSVACIPLVSRDRVLGSIFIITHEFKEFTAPDIELLTSIGRQIGGAVQNAHLYLQAEQQLRELEALYQADEQLYRYLELERVLNTLVEVAVEILQADKSSLLVWDEQRENLIVKAERGFSEATLARMVFAPGEGSVGLVAQTGKPVIVEDSEKDELALREIIYTEGIRSFMHVPIMVAGQIFGVFNVDYVQPRAFGIEEQRLFAALAQRAALAIENAQLYTQAQQAAVLEERQRLARELHDAVTQTLFSASLIADVLPRLWDRDQQEGLRRLQELRQLTRGALAEMRTLLVELRPAALVEADLRDLLFQLAAATEGRTQMRVEVNIEGDGSLPENVKVALYRITQEAMNNVAKHAAATETSVCLCFLPESVELSIMDNGRGFDPQTTSADGFGLSIMQERVRSIGASLDLNSQIGNGTEISVSWPVQVESKSNASASTEPTSAQDHNADSQEAE